MKDNLLLLTLQLEHVVRTFEKVREGEQLTFTQYRDAGAIARSLKTQLTEVENAIEAAFDTHLALNPVNRG